MDCRISRRANHAGCCCCCDSSDWHENWLSSRFQKVQCLETLHIVPDLFTIPRFPGGFFGFARVNIRLPTTIIKAAKLCAGQGSWLWADGSGLGFVHDYLLLLSHSGCMHFTGQTPLISVLSLLHCSLRGPLSCSYLWRFPPGHH